MIISAVSLCRRCWQLDFTSRWLQHHCLRFDTRASMIVYHHLQVRKVAKESHQQSMDNQVTLPALVHMNCISMCPISTDDSHSSYATPSIPRPFRSMALLCTHWGRLFMEDFAVVILPQIDVPDLIILAMKELTWIKTSQKKFYGQLDKPLSSMLFKLNENFRNEWFFEFCVQNRINISAF